MPLPRFKKLDAAHWFDEQKNSYREEEAAHAGPSRSSGSAGGRFGGFSGRSGGAVAAGGGADLRGWWPGGQDRRATVLMVAEKPSIANTLARALAGGARWDKRRGVSPFSPVYEWQGVFNGAPADFRVTAVTGHIQTLDFTEEYNNWQAHEPRELFDAPTEKRESDPRSKMMGHIRGEAAGAHVLVLWLDCDREGENICYEVIDLAKERMAEPRLILRARFSSLDPKDLQQAYASLGVPDKRLADAVDARQAIDLKLGVAFTRFITLFVKREFRSLFDALGIKVISYGPCQVPALWFVVKRHDEIAVFEPKPFWELSAEAAPAASSAAARGGRQSPIRFARKAGPLWNEAEASTALAAVERAGSMKVLEVARRTVFKQRPLPLNTVRLLQKASSQLRMGAHEALEAAERLYIAGLISYPRTETTRHAGSFDAAGLLTDLKGAGGRVGEAASQLLLPSRPRPVPREDGHDAGDHPPITPIRAPQESDRLDAAQRRLYELVASHFVQSVSEDQRAEEVTVTVEAGGEVLAASATNVLDAGWTALDPGASSAGAGGGAAAAAALAALAEGQRLQIARARSDRRETQPPRAVTESDLLGLMDRFGVGTDASMATHVQTIVQRGYVELDDESRRMRPLPLGSALVHTFAVVDADLCSPEVRACIEADVSEVARGQAPRERVEQRALSLFASKLQRFAPHAATLLLMLAAAAAAERGRAPPPACAEPWARAVASVAAVDLDRLGGAASSAPPPSRPPSALPAPSPEEVRDALVAAGLAAEERPKASLYGAGAAGRDGGADGSGRGGRTWAASGSNDARGAGSGVGGGGGSWNSWGASGGGDRGGGGSWGARSDVAGDRGGSWGARGGSGGAGGGWSEGSWDGGARRTPTGEAAWAPSVGSGKR